MSPSGNSGGNSFRLVSSRKSCPNCDKSKFTVISSRDFYSIFGKMISSRRCCINRSPADVKKTNANQLQETSDFPNKIEKIGRNANVTLISSNKLHNFNGRAISSRLVMEIGSTTTKVAFEVKEASKIEFVEKRKINELNPTVKHTSAKESTTSKLSTIKEAQEDDGKMNIGHSIEAYQWNGIQNMIRPSTYSKHQKETFVIGKSKKTQGNSLSGSNDKPPMAVIPSTKKKKNRCHKCSKNVRLSGITCKCKGLFCAVHRYTDMHDCNYDWIADGIKEIAKNNPLVIGEKVSKI